MLYLQIIPTFVLIKSNPIINKTSTAVMKKKTILFASCLLGVFLSPPVRGRTFMMKASNLKRNSSKDLDIPAGFQWNNSSSRRNSSCYYPPLWFPSFG